MDFNEATIKEEVNNFVASFQKLLPKKKNIINLETPKQQLLRLADMHYEAKSVFPMCFTGAKVFITREIMNRVKLVQQYNYGRTKDTYKSFTQLIYKEMEPKSVDEGLLIDSAGSATATYHEDLEGGYTMRLTSRIRDLISSETEIVFDRENAKSVASVSCSLRDVDPNTLRLVTQWVYKVVPELCVGSEVSFRPMLYPPFPDVSLTARYDRPSFTLSSTISKAGFQVCLYKQFAQDLRISTIINEDTTDNRTTIGVALHKKYDSGSELKMFVDSQRSGGFTYQKDVLFYEPQNEIRVLRLIGSTLIDKQRRVRFGFGFELDF